MAGKKDKKTNKLNFGFSLMGADIFFFAIVLALTAYGLVMVYSASAPSAFYVHNDSTHGNLPYVTFATGFAVNQPCKQRHVRITIIATC